jgi:hypothetical protein
LAAISPEPRFLPGLLAKTSTALLLASLGASSCHPSPPALVGREVSRSAPKSLASTCELLHERHRRVLARLPKAPAGCDGTYLAPDGPFACEEQAGGAWALVASAEQPRRDSTEEPGDFCPSSPILILSLVFRSASGREVIGPSFRRFTDTYGGSDIRLQATIDFDGDAVPEAFVIEDFNGEGFADTKLSVKTVRDGAIVDYGPARGLTIAEIEDFDGDGRPDLVYAAHRATTSELGVAGRETTFVALAHSRRDGTFALDDDVTARFYLRACPSAPTTIVVSKDGFRDDPATGKNIVCARAWGNAESEIRDALERDCTAWSEQELSCDPARCPASQPCPAWWKSWLARASPHLRQQPIPAAR